MIESGPQGRVEMEALLEKRAHQLASVLDGVDPNCGLLVIQKTVVMRCPGSPYADSHTVYDEADLNNAIELNLLEKRKVTGSYEWEYYKKREPRIGEFVSTSRGLVKIVYHAEGMIELEDSPKRPIPISDLRPSPDGRPNVWVIVPK